MMELVCKCTVMILDKYNFNIALFRAHWACIKLYANNQYYTGRPVDSRAITAFWAHGKHTLKTASKTHANSLKLLVIETFERLLISAFSVLIDPLCPDSNNDIKNHAQFTYFYIFPGLRIIAFPKIYAVKRCKWCEDSFIGRFKQAQIIHFISCNV